MAMEGCVRRKLIFFLSQDLVWVGLGIKTKELNWSQKGRKQKKTSLALKEIFKLDKIVSYTFVCKERRKI